VLRAHSVSPSDLGHHRAWRHRFFDNPGLLGRGPAATTARPRDHLQPTDQPRRLDHMLDYRHKTISPEIVRLGLYAAAEKVRSRRRLPLADNRP
jgi:hypothetical protein